MISQFSLSTRFWQAGIISPARNIHYTGMDSLPFITPPSTPCGTSPPSHNLITSDNKFPNTIRRQKSVVIFGTEEMMKCEPETQTVEKQTAVKINCGLT